MSYIYKYYIFLFKFLFIFSYVLSICKKCEVLRSFTAVFNAICKSFKGFMDFQSNCNNKGIVPFFNSKKVQTVLANHDFKLETEVKKKRNLVKNG